MRIIPGDNRKILSTNLSIDLSKWDKKNQKEKENTEEIRTLNNNLINNESRLMDSNIELNNSGQEFKVIDISDKNQNKTETIQSLMELINEHNQRFKELVKISNKAEGTLKRYTLKKISLNYF